tara:strand:- start:256 stop:885 length:630 start_codon:yes stop_codon:yes gene_type:complete
MEYDANCKKCTRLNHFLLNAKKKYPAYFCKPVPSFGEKEPGLLIIGLAPGMHGANNTGRPFTGDHAGILLYKTLFMFGFSNKPSSISTDDGLALKNCRITNAVKCLPPENKPTLEEVKNCTSFLRVELNNLPNNTIVLALGLVAHSALLIALNYQKNKYKFSHGGRHVLPNKLVLYNSYHCSRYNTQTKRLTEKMFEDIFLSIRNEMEN